MVATYEKLSSTLTSVVNALVEVVERADRDAEAQEALVASVERAAEQLSTAQRGVDDFLASLASALGETHEAFSREINATLDRTHESFHHSLASATETLASTVSGFSDFLESDFRESVDDLRAEFVRLRVGADGTSPS
jgi:ABC-type transporter Mla subunit MlaD